MGLLLPPFPCTTLKRLVEMSLRGDERCPDAVAGLSSYSKNGFLALLMLLLLLLEGLGHE
jgi:hypothetical protein